VANFNNVPHASAEFSVDLVLVRNTGTAQDILIFGRLFWKTDCPFVPRSSQKLFAKEENGGILMSDGSRIGRCSGIAIYYHNGGDDCHFLPFEGFLFRL